jgi:hypothetical protein
MQIAFANLDCDVKKFQSNNILDNLICLSDSAIKLMRAKEIPFKSYRDYFTPEDYYNINTLSLNYMKAWQNFKDYTYICGADVSDFFINMHSIFTGIIKKLYLCDLVISREMPTSVYATNSSRTLASGISILTSVRNIPFTVLKVGVVPALSSTLTDHSFENSFGSALRSTLKQIRSSNLGPDALDLVNQVTDLPSRIGRMIVSLGIDFFSKNFSVRKFYPSALGSQQERYDVLALCPNINAVTTVYPVLKDLKDSSNFTSICITMYNSASNKCHDLGLEFANIADYPPDADVLKKNSLYVHSIWGLLRRDFDFKSKFTYSGINLFTYVEPSLHMIFSAGFPYAIGLMESLTKILNQYSPRIVVLPEDTGLGTRPLARLAKLKGIKTLTIQHGTMEDVTLYSESISDKMAVWGKDSLQILSEHGVPRDRMVVTGMPRLDEVRQYSEFTRSQVLQQLKIDPSYKMLVWTPSPFERLRSQGSRLTNEDLSIYLDDISSVFEDIQVVAKIHPLDKVQNYGRTKSMIIVQDIDTQKLLYACDALLVTNSTTGVEAIALSKPLIYLNFHKIPETIPYVKYGAALRATNQSELIDRIKDLSNNITIQKLENGRKEFISRYLSGLDGKASERVARVIIDMIT